MSKKPSLAHVPEQSSCHPAILRRFCLHFVSLQSLEAHAGIFKEPLLRTANRHSLSLALAEFLVREPLTCDNFCWYGKSLRGFPNLFDTIPLLITPIPPLVQPSSLAVLSCKKDDDHGLLFGGVPVIRTPDERTRGEIEEEFPAVDGEGDGFGRGGRIERIVVEPWIRDRVLLEPGQSVGIGNLDAAGCDDGDLVLRSFVRRVGPKDDDVADNDRAVLQLVGDDHFSKSFQAGRFRDFIVQG